MPIMKDLLGRTAVVVLVILASLLAFLPNLLEQELVIAFHTRLRMADRSRVAIDPEVIKDFRIDRENGLRYFFPDAECTPEAGDGLPETHRCVMRGRFLTAARVNSLTHAFPQVVDESFTYVKPHAIEKFFAILSDDDARNLKVKLGLDLQGGMRAVFRADFAGYQDRQQEKVKPLLEKAQTNLEAEEDPEKKAELQKEVDTLTSSLELTKEKKLELLNGARKVLGKRLTDQGLTEPEIRVQQASYTISVDMPGAANSSDVLNRLGDMIRVEYRIVNKKISKELMDNHQEAVVKEIKELRRLLKKKRMKKDDIDDAIARITELSGLKAIDGRIFIEWAASKTGQKAVPRSMIVLGPPALDGEDMRAASVINNPQGPGYFISFLTSARGEQLLGDLTSKNIDERMAILWGNRVISSPTIQSRISSSGQITGNFSLDEAREVASVIQDGALPVELQVLSVNFIGPSLGQESINTGIISILLGFVVVILFMLGYYRMTGIVAVFALFLNLFMMAAIMSIFEFTLTLPGFAGVILTVGMAVDASVIIFEKIKEDLSAGKPASVCIEHGFDASFWTILDANVTTLIAAVILWSSGDAPIVGFALVLFFGLLSSMFTALYVSRLLFDWGLHLLRFQTLSIGWRMQKKEESK